MTHRAAMPQMEPDKLINRKNTWGVCLEGTGLRSASGITPPLKSEGGGQSHPRHEEEEVTDEGAGTHQQLEVGRCGARRRERVVRYLQIRVQNLQNMNSSPALISDTLLTKHK